MRRREFVAGLGSAAAWPLVARAQQPAMPVIGFISAKGPAPNASPNASNVKAFRAGLAEAGFIEGKNVSIEYRWANNNFSSLPDMAADLVRRQVAVIVASGAAGAVFAAKAATSTIPIVFTYVGDPVKDGLVASLNRPGGTGITAIAGDLGGLNGKRLELLLQLVPRARKVAFLSGARAYEQQTTSMLAAGRALGVEIMIVECRSDRDYEGALAKMVGGRADAMIVGTFALPNLGEVVRLAALRKMPTIYPFESLVRAGGLMSYGADERTMSRRLGRAYVARILKGETPADIPVEQPTKFELVINLSAAKALNLEVPPSLLAVADEVIEYEFPRESGEYFPNRGWNLVPTITVVSPAGDPRLPLVADAVAFWNQTFLQLGTPFKLGALTPVVGTIPDQDIKTLSSWKPLPESLNRIAGNIVVVLSGGEFLSFTSSRREALNKVVVAIKDYRLFPLTLPNVARNVIAHELGRAIGLSHNADPTTLMCGRPAPCRPDLFASDRPKYFPLTEAEKAELEQMYPKTWQASR